MEAHDEDMPVALEYLLPFASRYGSHFRTEEQITAFIHDASAEQVAELRDLASTVRRQQHYPVVIGWLKVASWENNSSAGDIYFLFGLMDAIDCKFE